MNLRIFFNTFTPIRIAVAVGAILFFAFLILGDQGVLELNKLVIMKKQLIQQKETLKSDIERLSKEKELLNNPKSLEFVIRNELGFIKPGEIIFQEKDSKREGKVPDLN